MDINKKEKIKKWIAISFLIIIISIVLIIIIKYQVDGEVNMPFKLSKITIISTAEGVEKELIEGEEKIKWNLDINQNNDIYFFIDKNENYKKTASINYIDIENIVTTKLPTKGNVMLYMPNSGEGRTYIYNDKYIVKDKLTYTGAKASNEKTLEIGNQGGKILIRVANTKIGNYQSNEDAEIKHNGTLITKTDAKIEDIKFDVSFDIIIVINNIKYKANINLKLPCGNIIEEGTSTLEKTDMSDVIFKRL